MLVGKEHPVVNATGLTKGQYIFQLTAWNTAGAQNNDTVSVTVLQSIFLVILSRGPEIDQNHFVK